MKQRSERWGHESRNTGRHQNLEEAKHGFSPRASRGNVPLPTPWFWTYRFQHCYSSPRKLIRSHFHFYSLIPEPMYLCSQFKCYKPSAEKNPSLLPAAISILCRPWTLSLLREGSRLVCIIVSSTAGLPWTVCRLCMAAPPCNTSHPAFHMRSTRLIIPKNWMNERLWVT